MYLFPLAYVPETKLQSAIDDIVNYNTRVEHENSAKAAWHFNGEQITQGTLIVRLQAYLSPVIKRIWS